MILLVFAVSLYECRNKSDFDKYRRFINWKPVMLILTFAGLGIPLIVTIPLLLCLNRWRNHRRKCPNCGTVMNKVDEVHDNDYLTRRRIWKNVSTRWTTMYGCARRAAKPI